VKVRKSIRKINNGFDYWITFVINPGVEPTNNRAERALRRHSSKLITDGPKCRAMMTLRLIAAEIEPGPKGYETHFSYMLHQKTDINYNLIREIETTTASLHESQINLSVEGKLL